MNFTPFTGHIPTAAALPTIQQFAAKFGYDNAATGAGAGVGVGVVQETRYQGTSNVQFAVAPAPATLEAGVKFRQAESVVVVSAAQPSSVTLAGIAPMHSVNAGVKYQTISASTSSVNLGNISYGGQGYLQESHVVKETREKREREEYHEFMLQQVAQATPLQQGQQLVVVLHEPKEASLSRVKQEGRLERVPTHNEYIIVSSGVDGSESWQLGGVPDYLSALPLPLHHLLKYSPPAPAEKREEPTIVSLSAGALPPMPAVITCPVSQTDQQIQTNSSSVVIQSSTVIHPAESESPEVSTAVVKRKKKRKSTKEKKERPKPGEIRLTTALDGSTLYCCPECHMAYPERDLLEQHLLGHTMERRFICNICNAALKRKDHLTRHKQSHNPERPHICSVCLKAFKRKEQLTLHFVIHSGEKRHICNECGKGFYRKDHLRKHSRSHIARRVKAELSAGNTERSSPPLRTPPAPAPTPC